jgi:hypothetical protein
LISRAVADEPSVKPRTNGTWIRTENACQPANHLWIGNYSDGFQQRGLACVVSAYHQVHPPKLEKLEIGETAEIL